MTLRGGRYEMIGRIASGGMATVHLGRAIGPGGFERLVAIKTVHDHLASDPEVVAMFLDEARLAARIHHPNVVATLDVGEDEHGIFLIMEYVDGPSLSGILRALRRSGQRLPRDVALRILLDMLAGLHAAHELRGAQGEPLHLVHRDVSPHNILVGVDGIARLTDFGVARAKGRISSTQAGQIKGKVAFMAPEQLEDGPIDRAADVYSAGVVLWEALTGERMRSAENEGALLIQAIRSEARSPREVDPTIPPALDAATLHALRTDPSRRFATAADFARALTAAGVPVAGASTVGAFVRALGIHQGPIPAGAAETAPEEEPPPPPAATPSAPAPPRKRGVIVTGAVIATGVAIAALTVGRATSVRAPAPSAPAAGSTAAPAPSAAPLDTAIVPPPAPPEPHTPTPAAATSGRPRAGTSSRPAASSAPAKQAPPSSTSFVPKEL